MAVAHSNARCPSFRRLRLTTAGLHASYTLRTRLVHASYTPRSSLLHASYTPLLQVDYRSLGEFKVGQTGELLRAGCTVYILALEYVEEYTGMILSEP